jgi:3-oxoadipate enol-lactonase
MAFSAELPMIPTFSTLGSGSTTVLLLHGAEGSHLTFAPQLETLAAAGYKAVAWDMPGYGSSVPIEPYNFKGLAAQCVALMQAHACSADKPVVLIGHGMGAALALEVTLRMPQLVQKVALINPICMHTGEMINSISHIISQFKDNIPSSMSIYADKVIATRVGSGHLPEGVRLLTHALGQVSAGTYRRALEALMGFDRMSGFARVTCPVLMVTGEQDPYATPHSTHHLAALMSAALTVDVQVLKGIGHYAHLEAPEEVDGLLLNWLAMSPALRHVLH